MRNPINRVSGIPSPIQRAMVLDLTADLRATWSIRMDSTMPVVSLGFTAEDPESTLRAAASASIASSFPTRALVWWWGWLISRTSKERSRRNLVSPAP